VDKRYTDRQAAALLRRLVAVEGLSVSRARRLFSDILAARLGDVAVQSAAQTVAAAPDEEITGLRRGTYAFLHQALGAKGIWPPISLSGITLRMSGPDRVEFQVSGDIRSMLTVQVYGLMRRMGHQLHRCTCGQLYVRVRRQRYCSARCQKRVYMRAFRSGQVGKE
jgi:hypothetical protein